MASVQVDTSEVRALIADMRGVDGRIRGDISPVIKKGAGKIKDDLIGQMRSSRHFKGADSIGYDMTDDFEAEIGPEKAHGKGSRGANHANIAYFGTPRGGGTVEDPEEALMRELPAFEKHLGDIAERAVFG